MTADKLRARGWMVAVHNDYMLHGVLHTFWLFTRGNQCVKGEGRTDAAALAQVAAAIDALNILVLVTKADVGKPVRRLRDGLTGTIADVRPNEVEVRAGVDRSVMTPLYQFLDRWQIEATP